MRRILSRRVRVGRRVDRFSIRRDELGFFAFGFGCLGFGLQGSGVMVSGLGPGFLSFLFGGAMLVLLAWFLQAFERRFLPFLCRCCIITRSAFLFCTISVLSAFFLWAFTSFSWACWGHQPRNYIIILSASWFLRCLHFLVQLGTGWLVGGLGQVWCRGFLNSQAFVRLLGFHRVVEL